METAAILGLLILGASMISLELGFSVAVAEIILGALASNYLGLETTPWIDFLATLAGVALTFLAGLEIDLRVLRQEFRGSLFIGGASFLLPFITVFAICYWLLGWSVKAALVGGIALSDTSLVIVYAVLVQTGLTNSLTGKMLMAATFVTNLGTAAVLSFLFMEEPLSALLFVLVAGAIVILLPRVGPWFFRRYGESVVEAEARLVLAALFILMLAAERGGGQAILPAFLLGLAMSRLYQGHPGQKRRLQSIAFALLIPFFSIKTGMEVSFSLLAANLGLLALLLGGKLTAKFFGVLPAAHRFLGRDSVYVSLLMSTGLTFGIIAALYGFSAGHVDRTQFSLLVGAIVASSIIPTLIAEKRFQPDVGGEQQEAAPAGD